MRSPGVGAGRAPGAPTTLRLRCLLSPCSGRSSSRISMRSERGEISGQGNWGEFFALLALTWTEREREAAPDLGVIWSFWEVP